MYLAIPKNNDGCVFVEDNRKAYYFDSMDELCNALRDPHDPEKWSIWRINSKERIQIHTLHIEERFEDPTAIQLGYQPNNGDTK